MNNGQRHGIARIIASKIGLVLLLFLIWWTIDIFRTLPPFQYVEQRDVRLAAGLALSFGTLLGAPVIGYLICADLIAKQIAFPRNIIVFVALAVVGYGLYVMVFMNRAHVPLHPVSDVWRSFGGDLLPIASVAAVLLARRVRRSM